jgi:hypothetical protein
LRPGCRAEAERSALGDALSAWLDQNLGRDAAFAVQAADHFDRQAALAAEYFGDARARADDTFQVFAGKAWLSIRNLIASIGSGGSIGNAPVKLPDAARVPSRLAQSMRN